MMQVKWWFLAVLLTGTIPNRIKAEKVKLLERPDQSSKNAQPWSWRAEGKGWTSATSVSGVVKSYTVCKVADSYTAQASWLVSDPIKTKEAKTLDINITYSIRTCRSLQSAPNKCKENFDVYILQTDDTYSSELKWPRAVDGKFQKIGTVNATRGSQQQQTHYSSFESFSVLVSGKNAFIAFRVNGSCTILSAVVVSYNVCPEKTLEGSLVTFPRIVAPANASSVLKVNGSCLKDTVPTTDELYGFCQSNGEWKTGLKHQGVCLCKAGLTNIGASCEVCPSGQYKDSAAKGNCTFCPANSVSAEDRKSCPCSAKFYKLPSEGKEEKCTEPPSAPRDLQVAFVNETAVTLKWKPPESLGGRFDLFYDIGCSVTCERNSVHCPVSCGSGVLYHPKQEGLNGTQVTITKLLPYTRYKFTVFSKNGVSGIAWKTDRVPAKSSEVSVRTKESAPGEPRLTLKRLSDTSVLVKWALRYKNGIIHYYLLTYYRQDDQQDKMTRNTTGTKLTVENLAPDAAYYFKVQAKNKIGFGPESKVIVLPETSPVTGHVDEMDMMWIIAAGGGGAGFVLILLIVAVIITVRRRNHQKKFEVGEETVGLFPTSVQSRLYVDPSNYGDPMEALKTFTMELNPISVKLECSIGRGEFAEVYRGTLRTSNRSETVAIKTLKNGYSRKARDDFLFEASIMGQFEHPHVILLKGVITKAKPMMIITEYMDGGSLDRFLKCRSGKLTSLQLIGMARGVAAGMDYLSSMHFIHRDLAARNILVGYNMICKVSDFGMSRELMDDHPDSEYQTQGGMIPVRWTAPEAIEHRKFSSASDVWSFGIVLWEIMSFGERPYWDWNNYEVMGRVESGYRLPAPMNSPEVVNSLMLCCWDSDRTKRPIFRQIVKRCDELIRSPELLRGSLACLASPVQTDFSQVKSVRDWLCDIGMDRYACKFENASYSSLPRVIELQDADLQGIGINLIGHRNKIRKSIKEMKKHFDGSEPAQV